jgi:hypothetical protein
MSRVSKFISVCVAASSVAVSPWVDAAPAVRAACSVTVDYVPNGTVAETYSKDFVVEQGTPFVDDFSTPTRLKTFTATVAREGTGLLIAIDYFNDADVFVAIGFDTKMLMRGGGALESTSGSQTFSSSQAVPPGNHTTRYTLACRRA